MRIVFMGEDSFSLVVLKSLMQDKNDILCVITPCRDDSFTHSRLEKFALKESIRYLRPLNVNSQEIYELMLQLEPDLLVSAHFSKIISPLIFNVPKYGGINLHPSMLPKYRGMSPQHWPIINNDSEIGITVHGMDEVVDRGKIIIQRTIDLPEDIYIGELQLMLLPVYETIVKDAVRFLSDPNFEPKEQLEVNTSYHGKIKKSDRTIDKNTSKHAAYRLVRAFSKPYDGAVYDDCVIWRAHISDEDCNIANKFPENGIYFNTSYGDFIRFHDGLLFLDDITQNINFCNGGI